MSQADPSSNDDGFGAPSVTGGTATGANPGTSGGTGGGTVPPLPPEQEKEDSFELPVQSGRWVWSANPESGRVAVIDTRSLRVQLAVAGFAPTYLAALPVAVGGEVTSSAIVLNAKSADATLMRRSESAIDVVTVPTHAGANAWAVSASGRWAIAWSDSSLVKDPDPADSFQDITVIDTAGEPPRATRLSVGYRPNRIFFQDDESQAFVVSAPGITILELAAAGPSVSSDVALSEVAGEKPLDVSVVPSGSSAFFRVEGSRRVGVVQLPSGARTNVTLSGPITDLDLVADGTSAIAVVRGQPIVQVGGSGGIGGTAGGAATGGASGNGGTAASAGLAGAGGQGSGSGGASGAGGNAGGVFGQGGDDGEPGGDLGVGDPVGGSGSAEAGAGGMTGLGGSPVGQLTPPASGYGPSEVAVLSLERVLANPTAFDSVLLDDLVGSVAVSSDGSRAVLFSTVTELDRITALSTDPGADDYLESRPVRVRAPVDAVFIAPDTGHALVALRASAGGTIGGAFGVVPLLASLGVKIQPTDAPITGVAFAPSPTTSAILTAATGKTAYLVQFPALRIEPIALPSLPLAAGIVADEKVGYVAQKHPGGRISFVNLETGEPRMLTGFELAGAVIDGD